MTTAQEREQLFLELINRSRLDPLLEAARFGLSSLSEGTSEGISAAPKQVLAANSILASSAASHAAYLSATNTFSHTGQGGTNSNQRMVAAGYGVAGSFGSGENLAWVGSSGGLDEQATILQEHKNLFLSAGHRENMLDASFREVGVNTIRDTSYQGYDALITAHNFGYKPGGPVFVTGVAYNDRDGNDFYSMGEGNAGQTVRLFSGSTEIAKTATAAAGGYQLAVNPQSAVEVVFSGTGVPVEAGVSLVVAGSNAKVDYSGSGTIETNASATLTRGTQNLVLLGMENESATGNGFANTLTGNRGSNVLSGGGGDDRLYGGQGNDLLIGGAGADVLSGGDGTADRLSYATSRASVVANLTTNRNAGGDAQGDMISGVEALLGSGFADALSGNGSSNMLSGGSGNDVLDGMAGNDILLGGAGADRFLFAAQGFGRDMIRDFADGTDSLVFYRSVADSVSDFSIVGNGTTQVTLSLGDQSITLYGANAINLGSSDFAFI